MAKYGEMGSTGTTAIRAPMRHGDLHIVDQLIAERGEVLASSWTWPLLKPLLYRILHYHDAVRMADEIATLSGVEAMAYVSDLLQLNLEVTGTDRIPEDGAFILAANHPTGIADGVAVYNALKPARNDIAIFTNRDAKRINTRFDDLLIPVEWRDEFRNHSKTKETLRLSSQAFREERAVVIFPSGRIAYWQDGGLNEREVVRLRKTDDHGSSRCDGAREDLRRDNHLQLPCITPAARIGVASSTTNMTVV